MARITVGEAEARVAQWEAQRDEQLRAPTADYYRHATAGDLIHMWRTGKNVDGRRLSTREFGCLVERWVQVFGDLPADRDDIADNEQLDMRPEPMPPDDTMLRVPDVERLTGISHSTIKRMVSDGRFPKPMRIGERAKGWPARDVYAWRELLEEQKRRPRQ